MKNGGKPLWGWSGAQCFELKKALPKWEQTFRNVPASGQIWLQQIVRDTDNKLNPATRVALKKEALLGLTGTVTTRESPENRRPGWLNFKPYLNFIDVLLDTLVNNLKTIAQAAADSSNNDTKRNAIHSILYVYFNFDTLNLV